MQKLKETRDNSFCEWKGLANYFDIVSNNRQLIHGAWVYHKPTTTFIALKDHVAFYAHVMDACYVNGEKVMSQPGNFYGGWVTSNLVGPFKGELGTMGW
tara:strand:- start:4169 stop:4465 length:297 start_codon:yes stop_codon:yes gene_type:complete